MSIEPFHEYRHRKHSGVTIGILRHLSPWQNTQDADIHQQIQHRHDSNRTKHRTWNCSLRITNFRTEEADVVITPVVISRDQHSRTEAGKERSIDVKCTRWEIKRAMSIEVRK